MHQHDNTAVGDRRVTLHGLPIDPLTEDAATDELFSRLGQGEGGVVLTPNLDHLQRYAREPAVRGAYEDADLVLADGMPLVWASRLQGTPLPERVPGSDLVWTVSARAASEQASVFLLGGSPGVATAAGDRLAREFPGLRIAGCHFPDYGFLGRRDEVDQMLDLVMRAAPSVVFVGLPSPAAERTIELLRPRLPRTWFLGIGITLSFVAGDVKRAPRWTHRIGLEWLWRLIQEPRRLAGRYLLVDLPFAFRLVASALRHRYVGTR
jgi:N-acetylglucosaminyldiphosphoundecaprenol N-acetyl-beta-D-mannosaminyltransferase